MYGTPPSYFPLIVLLFCVHLAKHLCLLAPSRYVMTSARALEKAGFLKNEAHQPSASGAQKLEYKGSFDLPAEGADPFNSLSILRANAVALKNADMSAETLSNIAQLVKTLVQEEASNIQHQSDLWLIEKTKRAVDLLYSSPTLFPTAEYALREGNSGKLYVMVGFGIPAMETSLVMN